MTPLSAASFERYVALSLLLAMRFCCQHWPTAPESRLSEVRPIWLTIAFVVTGGRSSRAKAGLRLDMREAALRGGDSGDPAIVPGKPDTSELIHRIASRDDSERMPRLMPSLASLRFR